MVTDRNSIKKMFPNLFKELEGGVNKVAIEGVRANASRAEESEIDAREISIETKTVPTEKFRHYNPDITDFIRRCDTKAQAEEIVAFMLKRGEITEEYACEVRDKLRREGIRSFGPKKEDGYYFKKAGLC